MFKRRPFSTLLQRFFDHFLKLIFWNCWSTVNFSHCFLFNFLLNILLTKKRQRKTAFVLFCALKSFKIKYIFRNNVKASEQAARWQILTNDIALGFLLFVVCWFGSSCFQLVMPFFYSWGIIQFENKRHSRSSFELNF